MSRSVYSPVPGPGVIYDYSQGGSLLPEKLHRFFLSHGPMGCEENFDTEEEMKLRGAVLKKCGDKVQYFTRERAVPQNRLRPSRNCAQCGFDEWMHYAYWKHPIGADHEFVPKY